MGALVKGAPVVGHRVFAAVWQQPAGQLALVAIGANLIPAGVIQRLVALYVLFGHLVGRMHSLKGQVAEKRFALCAAAINVADQFVRVGERGVEVVRQLHRRAILNPGGGTAWQVVLGFPVVGTAFHQGKRAVKTARHRLALRACAQVPLARHVGAVARVLQQARQGNHAVVQPALVTRLPLLVVGHDFLHVAHAHQMVVDAGHQHRAGG